MRSLYFLTDLHITSSTPSSRVDDYADAIFKKVEFVFNEAASHGGIVVIGGDIFHTPTQPDFIKSRFIELCNMYPVDIYSIWGNHDLLYYNFDFADRCSLELLFKCGALKRLGEEPVDLGNGWRISGQTLLKGLPDVPDKTLVFSHCYFTQHFTDKLFLTEGEVESSKAHAIFMGHDHTQYPLLDISGTTLVRPGSVSRGAANKDNESKIPSYAVFDFQTGLARYCAIPHKPFSEVFREKAEDIISKREVVTFEDVKTFIEDFKTRNLDVDPFVILRELDLRREVEDVCRHYLSEAGLTES